jgi:hypothetical protein
MPIRQRMGLLIPRVAHDRVTPTFKNKRKVNQEHSLFSLGTLSTCRKLFTTINYNKGC